MLANQPSYYDNLNKAIGTSNTVHLTRIRGDLTRAERPTNDPDPTAPTLPTDLRNRFPRSLRLFPHSPILAASSSHDVA